MFETLTTALNISTKYRILLDDEIYHIEKFCILFNMESNEGYVELGWRTLALMEDKKDAYLFYEKLIEGDISENGYKIIKSG
jgi:hypothetical protein